MPVARKCLYCGRKANHRLTLVAGTEFEGWLSLCDLHAASKRSEVLPWPWRLARSERRAQSVRTLT